MNKVKIDAGDSVSYREYPGFKQNENQSEVEHHLENLTIKGYSVMTDVWTAPQIKETSELLMRLYDKQEREFGLDRLQKLNESEVHRGLVCEDQVFLDMLSEPKVLDVVHALVGATAILNLQNASCLRSGKKHYQSAWHRDFAKDFVSSKCLAVNAFWCISDFTAENGATWLLPHSHKLENFPTERYIRENGVQVEAPAGSVIFWDSLILHKAGFNTTEHTRLGINHMYTRPFLKQQIDYPEYLKGKIDIESALGQLLGFWAIPPKSVEEFRVDPDKRTYRRGQG